ncbi:unnamed protein product [Phytophthora lilii]|uniref:Unnamed protein product n=1 Tax=Phytophthora lilii TaxID=2077276 RepID=A0A9W6WJX7_9STRA|nr:unnamed protein product [Phytophthora lilii]
MHQVSFWMAMDNLRFSDFPRLCMHVCSTAIEAVVSTTRAIAHTILDTATTMLQSWWSGYHKDDSTSLEVVERLPKDPQGIDDILEENNRLKRMLEFAMTSHVIMNEATCMLEDGAELWMKQAEDVIDAKVHEAEKDRDALALRLEGVHEQLSDRDQEIE